MNIYIIFIILFIFVIFILYLVKKEKWSNTYSGWPGPIESPFRSNIPALYGDPKYMSSCEYKPDPNSSTGYFKMKNLP
jgi:hypothetical protein